MAEKSSSKQNMTQCVKQVPVFITAVWAVRHMAVSHWLGFDTGGTLWFENLTQPALDAAHMAAPMGPMGVVLPASVVMLMLMNIDSAFTPLSQGRPGESTQTLLNLGPARPRVQALCTDDDDDDDDDDLHVSNPKIRWVYHPNCE